MIVIHFLNYQLFLNHLKLILSYYLLQIFFLFMNNIMRQVSMILPYLHLILLNLNYLTQHKLSPN